ncbi:uncharacterized protein N7525_008973, partial [Penicillium rubens]|uniref:uncharacterized protein n=1 Tax=Penicillium rubens TaxID=1108849 RepID=UPI002A5AE4AB
LARKSTSNLRLRHHPPFGGTLPLPERNLRGPNSLKQTPLNNIFLIYSVTTPQLRKPSLVAQNLQKLQFTLLRILIGIGHRILIYRPRLAHEHPTISGEASIQ